MSTITAVIPTLNEENNIERAIRSVSWCDKVFVIDSGSSDKTIDIAKKLGARVFVLNRGKLFKGVQENINWVGRNCGTDWVLRLDADEEVTPALKSEIENILSQEIDSFVAYGVPRSQFFLGGFLKGGDWAYDRLIRLYKPEFVQYDTLVSIHEQFKVQGNQSELKYPLNHYSHPTFKEILRKWNLYTDLEVKDLKVSKLEAFLKMVFMPIYVFLRWMIYHKGWIDGWRGVVAGGMRGYYDFLKFGKFLLKG